MISRSLAALREQHRIMEQEYLEKLRAIRSELRTIQEGPSSTSPQSTHASASVRKRCRYLSFPDSSQPIEN